MKHQFVVYDERANPIDGTDDAMCLVIEDTQRQAERWPEPGYVWRYDVQPQGDGKNDHLINETFISPTRKLAKAQRTEQARRMK